MSTFRSLTAEIFAETNDSMFSLYLAGTLIDNGFVEEEDSTFRDLTRVIFEKTKSPEKSLMLAGKLIDSGAVPLKTSNVTPIKAVA